MNKYQKELLQNSLKDEKKVLSDLRKTYEQAEKDIDQKIEDLLARFNATDDANLQRTIIYQVDYQKALKKQISGILDNLNGQQFNTISDYIQNCYEDGFIGTLYDLQGQGVPLIFPIDQEQVTTAIAKDTKLSKSLYSALGEDVADLKKRVQSELSRGIAQNLSYSQIAQGIRNQTRIGYNRAVRIARTEGHRVQQAAQADAQLKAKEAGADVVKQWDSTLDGRTRNAHRALDGQIRELDEPFEIGGLKAQYPGAFGVPGQDILCRCVTLTRARWAVDDETGATKFDNETGQLVEIESKNYQDFKKKYWKEVNEGHTSETREQKSARLKSELDAIKQKYSTDLQKGNYPDAYLQECGEVIQREMDNGPVKNLTEWENELQEMTIERREIVRKRGQLTNAIPEPDWKDPNSIEEYHRRVAEVTNSEEFKKLQSRNEQLNDRAAELQRMIKETKEGAARDTLSLVRDLGLDKNQEKLFETEVRVLDSWMDDTFNWNALTKPDINKLETEGKDILKRAYSNYPTDWLDKSLKRNEIYLSTSNRGFYVDFNLDKNINANVGSSILDLGSLKTSFQLKQAYGTAVHETGHRMENILSEILKAEKTFYTRRTAGEALVSLRSVTGNNAFSAWEMTRKDNFIDPYMGKDYGGRGYELVSKGFEMAFTDPRALTADPDFAKFIYGILAGV